MEPRIESAVERAIITMRDHLGEPLTVDDLARSAMFSKFHFTRVFQQATGVSPARFLSALRLRDAQRLLVSTSLTVAEVSQRVGYGSVGTFSSRFSRSVCMSPTAYRRRAGFAARIEAGGRRTIGGGTVHCRIHRAPGAPRLVFAGLFPEHIPQGRPVRCAVLPDPDSFTLRDVPPGTWHLLAQSVPGRLDDPDGYRANVNEAVSVAAHGPFAAGPQTRLTVDLTFGPAGLLDPPVLLAMLDVRTFALRAVAAGREVRQRAA
jgi:AraC family transcriptional regulator